uniref:Putative secreted protein n=1 Tax=Anopheles marajoara TaxID=58244 RepID=A0A2M4CCH7_9DIPT
MLFPSSSSSSSSSSSWLSVAWFWPRTETTCFCEWYRAREFARGTLRCWPPFRCSRTVRWLVWNPDWTRTPARGEKQ